MRRVIAGLQVAGLALVLAGCGGGGQADEAGGSAEDEIGPKVYAQSVQAFSPYVEKWTTDGTSVTFEKINCLGDTEETQGTWEDATITWAGQNPMLGAGTGLTTQMDPLTDESLHRVGAMGSAVSDVDGQMDAHVERCQEAGEAVGENLLGW